MSGYEIDTRLKPAFMGHVPPDDLGKKYAQLEQAVRSGNEVLVKRLVDDHAPVNHSFPLDCLTPLHLAVHSRLPEIAQILLDKGADVNTKGFSGDTPLTLAAKTGNLSLIDPLLSHDVHYEKDDFNLSHFHIACMRNRVDVVEKLVSISQWTYLNELVDEGSIICHGYTPLHCAVHYDCIETVEYLLKRRATITKRDTSGLTPLHLADLQRNGKMIDLLLTAQKYDIKNPFSKFGLSHFHIACTRDNTSNVKHFLESGVDVDLSMEAYIKCSWPRNTCIMNSQWRPLNFALYYNCPRVVKLLLQAEAHLLDPIQTLIACELMKGNEKVYDFLTRQMMESQKVPDKGYEMLNSFIKTCTYDKLSYGRCNIVFTDIMTYDLDYNVPVWNGGTILHLVIDCENELGIQYFIDQGAEVMIQDNRGQTALHATYYQRNPGIFDKIVSKISYQFQNLFDNEGLSVFHILCTTNDLNLLKEYLALGVNVNAQVEDESELWAGYTPLHFACSHFKADVVELFLHNSADTLIKNKSGLNPFELVVEEMILERSFNHDKHFKM
ncbi:hypothetical protein QAD02_010073 [Eretmocerus hayati]|uniref:Uncharacterized protein n=1 Tax=Eretmocerus hayati TaxID=131215 RepID=A0ACC2NB55_9HYME|nr:hypothetical protein QAD02_010073 [Eretmocerus hayati]